MTCYNIIITYYKVTGKYTYLMNIILRFFSALLNARPCNRIIQIYTNNNTVIVTLKRLFQFSIPVQSYLNSLQIYP